MKRSPAAPETIDDYIAAFPPAVQAILQQLRSTIRSAAPEATEAMKYQIPTLVLNGNLVHFAAFRSHVGFYPTPSGIEKFSEELSGYATARGSVQFPLDRPIPFDLVRRIVEFRVGESRAKAASRNKHGQAGPD